MNYLKFSFIHITENIQDELVAKLNTIGFDGFEQTENSLDAYVPELEYDYQLFESTIDVNQFNCSKSIIKKQNWNALWESDFVPVSTYNPKNNTPFAYIRANFHEPNSSFLFDVVVTPKMSFGTGHHPTTCLMVEAMSEINFAGKMVIDFGTGTGVLAILAEMLQAKSVLGIDYDEWSIINAQENATVNNCTVCHFLQADTILPNQQADILLANINLNVIAANIVAIKNACHKTTTLLFSGIMLHDEQNLTKLLQNHNFNIETINKKNDWVAIMCKNNNS